jgi:hypothetical protein
VSRRETEVGIIKWMLGFTLAVQVATLFFIWQLMLRLPARADHRNAGSSKLLSFLECSWSGPTSSRRMRIASMPISRCWLIRSR